MKRCFALTGTILFAMLLRADADAPTDILLDFPSEASSPLTDLLGDLAVMAPEIGEPACAATAGPFTADLAGCQVADTSTANAFSDDFLPSVILLPRPSDVTQLLAQPATAVTPPQELSGAWLWISALMALALAGGRALRVLRNKA
jgi:hypothetical protein